MSNRAQAETSNKVKDILCHYEIKDWQSLPHFKHQNPVERRYQTVKTYVNKILDRTNAPAYTWMLCLTYVCGLLLILACDAIGGEIPLTMLTGEDAGHLPMDQVSLLGRSILRHGRLP